MIKKQAMRAMSVAVAIPLLVVSVLRSGAQDAAAAPPPPPPCDPGDSLCEMLRADGTGSTTGPGSLTQGEPHSHRLQGGLGSNSGSGAMFNGLRPNINIQMLPPGK